MKVAIQETINDITRGKKMEKNKLNRAAQFMPFEALNGLGDELRKREEEHTKTAKRELDEESKLAISEMLAKIQKGDMVSVVLYLNGHYITTIGKVDEIEHLKEFISVEYMRINFDDIYEIKYFEDDFLINKRQTLSSEEES